MYQFAPNADNKSPEIQRKQAANALYTRLKDNAPDFTNLFFWLSTESDEHTVSLSDTDSKANSIQLNAAELTLFANAIAVSSTITACNIKINTQPELVFNITSFSKDPRKFESNINKIKAMLQSTNDSFSLKCNSSHIQPALAYICTTVFTNHKAHEAAHRIKQTKWGTALGNALGNALAICRFFVFSSTRRITSIVTWIPYLAHELIALPTNAIFNLDPNDNKQFKVDPTRPMHSFNFLKESVIKHNMFLGTPHSRGTRLNYIFLYLFMIAHPLSNIVGSFIGMSVGYLLSIMHLVSLIMPRAIWNKLRLPGIWVPNDHKSPLLFRSYQKLITDLTLIGGTLFSIVFATPFYILHRAVGALESLFWQGFHINVIDAIYLFEKYTADTGSYPARYWEMKGNIITLPLLLVYTLIHTLTVHIGVILFTIPAIILFPLFLVKETVHQVFAARRRYKEYTEAIKPMLDLQKSLEPHVSINYLARRLLVEVEHFIPNFAKVPKDVQKNDF